MSIDENKGIVQNFFLYLGESNVETLSDLLADDLTFILEGSTAMSGTYSGKAAVFDELLMPISLAAALLQYRLRLRMEKFTTIPTARYFALSTARLQR